MIDEIASILTEAKVKATWLVTHGSPAIDRLRKRPDLFELGIHPNFLSGSSHGETVAEVLETCMRIVPEATTMRSHALVQSSAILHQVLELTTIRCDSSIMMPYATGLAPVGFPYPEGPLVRVPYFWEDDVEMARPNQQWRIGDHVPGPGLRVFDFHPVHLYLNAPDLRAYDRLKTLGPLQTISQDLAAAHVATGDGPRTLFLEIIERLARGGSQTLRDVATAYQAR